jgi:hypothetical protein
MLHPVIAMEEMPRVVIFFSDPVGLEEGGNQLHWKNSLSNQLLRKSIEDHLQKEPDLVTAHVLLYFDLVGVST